MYEKVQDSDAMVQKRRLFLRTELAVRSRKSRRDERVIQLFEINTVSWIPGLYRRNLA